MALGDLLVLSNINRVEDLERRELSQTITGDFEGSVAGSWVRLDENGAGIVNYNDKEYVTKRVGFTSIPAGTAVELSFGNGIYYSKW
jgi:hypothetical protein